MAFQIHNPEGKAIAINVLDAEAAVLWGHEVHPKRYAHPYEGDDLFTFNWFDIIGRNIDSNMSSFYKRYDGIMTWDMVHESMLINAIDVIKDSAEKIQKVRELYQPFVNLIKLWESKGYKPVKVTE